MGTGSTIVRHHWIIQAALGRRAAERALAETLEPLRPLPAAFQCDLADDTLTWSQGVFQLFGIAPGLRLDRREIVLMYEEESRELLERLRSAAIRECGSFTFEAKIRRADGEHRWMRVTADVIARGGRATHLYGTKQDITAEMIPLR